MADDDDKRFATEQVGAGVGSAAGVVIGYMTGGHPLAVGFGAIGGQLGALATRSLTSRAERRAPLLGEGFSRGCGGVDPAQLPADAHTEQTMVDTVRAMMRAVDDAVVPSLGYLAGRYTYQGKAPDDFFRGMVRTLVEVNADGLGLWRDLLHALDPRRGELDAYPDMAFIVSRTNPLDREGGLARAVVRKSTNSPTWEAFAVDDAARAAQYSERLWLLLRQKGLARAPYLGELTVSNFAHARTDDHAIEISATCVENMLDVLDPVSSK